jgi:phenylacetate-CoA ligase
MNLYNFFIERAIIPAFDAVSGSALKRQLDEWRMTQWLPTNELEALQRDRLARLLQFASERVPFYRDLGLTVGADPYEALRAFPIIRKPMLKTNVDRLVLGDRNKLIKEASSGSSGVQSVVYSDKKAESNYRAIQLVWWGWAGYRIGDPIIQTGMTLHRGLIKGVKDRLFRTKYVSAFTLQPEEVLEHLRELRRQPRKHLLGYASSLYVFAKVARDYGVDDVRFDSVISWGDKMFPHYRTLIEKQFATRVFDTYACSEGFMIAAQCPEMSYHVTTPQVYLELLDDRDRPVAPGELGNVVVTRLDNYNMPLIRFYLGDLAIAEPPAKRCACGRSLPLLARVVGRDTDIVRTRSGKHMIVHFFTAIMEHVPEVRQFRVIQRSLDEIELEYIAETDFEPGVLDRIRDKIHEKLGEPMPVAFKRVESIPPTASGKPQIIQSLIPRT